MFGELFELCGAGVDQFVQRFLYSLQVSKLFPQGTRLLSSTCATLKYISNPTRRHMNISINNKKSVII